jgi:ethanolamine utilization protein EutN
MGSVKTSKRDEKLIGFKLLIVQHVDPKYKEKALYQIVVDPLGAEIDDIVIISTLCASAPYDMSSSAPVDAIVTGIVDKLMTKK